MKSTSIKYFVFLFALVLLSSLVPNHASAAPNGSLGIGVEVLPAQSQEDTTLGADGSLWYLMPPGKSGSRSFRVNSVANVPMRVLISVGFGAYRNGESAFDDSKKSEIAPWAEFSDEDFVLPAGASRVIQVTFRVPKDAPIKANLATIFVRGSMQNQAASKAAFSVAGAARIAIPVFLGVGTAQQISINFKILRTTIKNVEGKRLAYIRIQNVGKTPVAPTGFIKVQAQEGSISIPDPIKVQSSTVIPGEERDVIFLIPAYIPNGKWTFMEEFQQGPVFQTAEADIALTKPSIFTKANILRFFIFVVSLFGLYFSLRYLRKSKKRVEAPEAANLIELELALEQIRKRNLRTRTAKKSTAKKSVSKKATRKKSTVKKTAKKSAAKKVVKKVVKKAPAKKAPAKKNATKKVATKRR